MKAYPYLRQMKGRLLLVTDHVYFEHDGKHYDNFGFNYAFFEPYLQVFERVDVLCRMKQVDSVEGLVQSSGDRLHFHGTPAVHGMKWFLQSLSYFAPYAQLISEVDAICYRIPATACWNVHVINSRLKQPKPHMFEFIGDPMDALFSVNDSFLKRKLMQLVGAVHSKRMRAMSSTAVSGSYVSAHHLQKKFPPPVGVETEAISSIRLNEDYIRETPRPLPPLNPVKIVEVASFVRQKNQSYLIRIAAGLKQKNIPVELNFVGTGAEQEEARLLVKKLGLEKEVIFHNQVTGFDNIVRILDSCHIFCLPSFSEGVPRSMIEAMARGLVCVGTPIGGIVELIDENYTFPINNVEAAVDKISDLVINSEDWEEIGKENIAKAREYGQSVLGPRRIKVFTQLRDVALNS